MKKIIKSVMLTLASLFIMFGCSNQASPNSTNIENLDPSTLSEDGKYFSVEGTSDGIKITFNDDTKIKQDSGSMIRIYDMQKNRLPFMIPVSGAADRSENKKVYTYKFVEKDTDYIVQVGGCFLDENSKEHWEDDWAKCTAKGGYNLSDYINIDVVKSVKMYLGYNGEQFYAGINSDKLTKKEDLIKDESILTDYKFKFETHLVLGEPEWKNTEWWAWADDIWIDYFRTEFLIDDTKVSGRMDDLKNKWDNKYCGYMVPKLKLNDGQEYEFDTIWSEQKVFDSSADAISFDDCTTPATEVTLADGNWTIKYVMNDVGVSVEANIKATVTNGSYSFTSGTGTLSADLSKVQGGIGAPEGATVTYNGTIVTVTAAYDAEELAEMQSSMDLSELPNCATIKTNSDNTKYIISYTEEGITYTIYVSKD